MYLGGFTLEVIAIAIYSSKPPTKALRHSEEVVATGQSSQQESSE